MENADFVLTGSSFLAADGGFPAASSPVQKMELPSSGSERKSDSPNETTKNETADSSDESVSTYHHSNQISEVVSERTYDLLTKSPHYMYPADSSDVEISKSFAAQSQPSAPPVDVSDSVSNADKYMDTLDGHLGKYQDHFTASVQTINQSTNYDLNQYAPEYSSKPSDGESGSLPHENQTEEPRDQSCNAVTARGKNSTSPSLDDKCVVNSAGGGGDFLDQDSSVHTEEEQTKINSENSGCDSNVLTDFSSYAVNMCDDDTKRSEPTPENRYQIDNQNNNLISHFNEEGNNGNMIEQSNTAQNCQQTNGQTFLNRHSDFQPMAFAVPDSAQRTVGSNNKKTEERTHNHEGLMRNITLIHQNNYSGVGHYNVTQSNNQPFQYQQHQPSSYELEPHHSNQQEEVDRSQHQHFQMHSYFHHQQHNNQSTLQHMHEDLHCYSGSTPTNQIHPHPHAIPRIDDVVMEDDHHKRHPSGFKLLSPVVKGENDDGYETSIGDNLTPNSRTSSSSTSSTASLPPVNPHHLGQTNLLTLSSGPLHNLSSSGGLIPKICSPEQRSMNSSLDNSYNYLKDEMDGDVQMTPGSLIENTMSGRQHGYPQMLIRCPGENVGHVDNGDIMPTASDCGPLAPLQLSTNTNIEDGGAQSLPSNVITSLNQSTIPEVFPTKKRGRKKKVGNENGSNHHGILKPIGAPKERKKHDRFNGMSEEEVSKRTLPDHLTDNLDIIIIGINPGLFAAYKGHHYAGPGNHFWKCLYLSGLIHEQMTAEEDYKLLDFGIGFTNIVERTTKGSADLTRKEIKEGCRILMEKLRKFQPKIAVFNGKLIYEVFSGKKDFHFGRQDDFVDGTSTYMWVMPSSSARCAQLPRAADKVPFYAALKKFRDYLNGLIPRIDDNECIFNDPKYKACCETEPKKKNLIYKDISHLSNCNLTTNLNNDHDINMLGNALDSEKEVLQNAELNSDFSIAPGKKKRGRPKKVKCVGDLLTAGGNLNMRAENSGSIAEFSSTPLHLSSGYNNDNLSKFTNLTAPKKKRGRPKKIKVAAPQIPANNDCIELVANSNSFLEDQMLEQTSNRNEIDNGNGHRNVQNSISSATDGVTHDLSNNDGTHTGRVFSSLKHSPSTADSSYCSPAMNAPLSSRPSVDFDSNMTGNCFHQQHEHQLALQSQRYDEHMHTHSSYQPNYSTHSDLSSEISAAIAADHLGESAASASPNAASGPYNPSTRIQMSESNINDIRYSSPSAINDRHRKPFNYDTYDSSPDRRFLSGNNNNANEENTHDHYISNQQSTTDLTGGQQTQQLSDVSSKSLSGLESLVHQIPSISSDMPQQTQPQLSNSDSPSRPEHLHRSSIPHSLNDFSCGDHCSSSCLYSHYASSLQHQLPPISPASKILSVSCCSTPSAGLISPHQHYATAVALYSPDNGANVNTPCQVSVSSPSSSSSSPLPLATTRNSRNNSSGSFNYTNLVSNSFSVSSLTSGEHPDAYRRNFISTPPSHSHLNASLGCNNGSGSVNNSPMYMEQPQILLPVSSLYHHHHNPYAQHPVYPRYSASPHPLPSGVSSSATSSPSPVQSPIPQLHHPAQPTHPTIHMPSPNYPYGYPNVGGYSQAHHHTVHHASVHHPSAAGYLPSHASMFDRLKSDFGYGGF